MRILLTGASGLLGRALIDLLHAEHDVVGLDRIAGPWTGHVGGIEDRDFVRRAMQGVEGVIHIASLHAPHVGRCERQAFIDVNVVGTLNLLEAATETGVRRFVYTSTTSVYGQALVPTDRAVWVTEDLAPRPRDIYDVTKLAAEGLCETVSREAGLPTICLRTARFFTEPPEVTAIHRLARGVDVRDAAEAHRLALADGTMQFGVFNIAARSPFRPEDMPELLVDALAAIRRRAPWLVEAFAAREWRLPASIDRVYAIERAEAALGYRPRYGVESIFHSEIASSTEASD